MPTMPTPNPAGPGVTQLFGSPRSARASSSGVSKPSGVLRPVKAMTIDVPASEEAAASGSTPRKEKQPKPPAMVVRSPSGIRFRSWVPRFRSSRTSTASSSGTKPPLAAQASTVVNTMTSEIADAVHAAAQAAADLALELGMPDDKCVQFYNAAVLAASRVLDPAGALSTEGDEGKLLPDSATRVEAILASAIKKSAVRVIDLFQEWDLDRDGTISKKEFRRGLQSTSISATPADIDALFAKWDSDGSGALDYNELNRALRHGLSSLSKEVSLFADREAEGMLLLGRGQKAAAVKQAKEAKEAAKEARLALSPRSQQLKDAALASEAQRLADMAKAWVADEEAGRRWTASKWLASRSISNVVADALELPKLSQDATSQFRYVKRLTRAQVEQLLASASLSGLTEFVVAAVESLQDQTTGSGEVLNEKFATTAKFQMTYGSLSLFYGGLESLLGPPKMYKGPSHVERSLFNMMEFEHLADKDSKMEFTAPNGVTTKAETEWTVVCCPVKGADYPERTGYREHHPSWCRVPTTLDVIVHQMEEQCNKRLRAAGHSELILEELVGGRLYTGPMYFKYNTVLRSKTKDATMVKFAKDLTKGNLYTTTIHAINSCVIKLSKLTKAGKVWRGIKDAVLPKEFWVPNDMGVRGGIEYGFSSTTTNREQALLFAGGQQLEDASTIFEMQMGMVDRGADLTWLSQYPHEAEVLLPPLTGIEALSVEVEGSMLVLHSRLSLNLASLTLEQVLSRRRKMLMDMVSGIELELRDQLGEQLFFFGRSLLQRALAYGPLSKDPEWFNDDENFSYVMQQVLHLQHGLVSQIHRLHVEEPELSLRGWSLGGSARVLVLAGWCTHRVASASGSAVYEAFSIDLRDAMLTTSEALELAELMTKQPRLTALDVRGNHGIGVQGAEALARIIESTRGTGVVSRSVCGVSPSSSSLEVGRVLHPVECRLLCAELRTFVWADGVAASMGLAPRKDRPATLNRRGAFAANEWQPLLWAAKENHLQIAKKLIELGVDVNEQQPATGQLSAKLSALHVAAQKGNVEMVDLLLAHGADRTLRDKHNNTALMLAEKKKHMEIIMRLKGEGGIMSGRPGDLSA